MADDSTSLPQDAQRLVLKSSRADVERAIALLISEAQQAGFEKSALFAIRLALEESLANAVMHGNANDPDKTIHLAFSVQSRSVLIEVADEGDGFNPNAVPDPTERENIAIPAGRGIMLMRAYMSDVVYKGRGNRVFMRYDRDTRARSPRAVWKQSHGAA